MSSDRSAVKMAEEGTEGALGFLMCCSIHFLRPQRKSLLSMIVFLGVQGMLGYRTRTSVDVPYQRYSFGIAMEGGFLRGPRKREARLPIHKLICGVMPSEPSALGGVGSRGYIL